MAQYNPPIQPTNDPNYENRSRPIDIPDSIKPRGVEDNRILPKGQEVGDRSAEYLGKAEAAGLEGDAAGSKGLGDLFSHVVGIGDFMAKAGVQMVKKDIEDKVYEVANNERMKYTAELEKVKAGGGVKNLLDAHAEMGDEETPAELEELPGTLDSLTGAKNAGKLSNTAYQARLLAAAKDLRARYPGFRSEIDEQFAKVTGTNPANAYIHGLVTDINRANASQNSEKNKMLNYIRGKAGFEGAEDAYSKVERGEWTGQDVIKWAAPQERFRISIENKKAIFDSKKMDREDQQREGKELIDLGASGVVLTHINKFMRENGLNSAADAQAMDARAKAGGVSAQQWVDIGDKWNNDKLQLKQAMLNDARQKGLVRALGLDVVNERIDQAMKPMDDIRDRIFNKDSGGIFKTAQSIRAMGDEDQKRILDDSIVGGDFRSIEAIKRIGGEQYLQSQNLQNIVSGLSGRFGEYNARWKASLATQTDMKNAGVPVTLNRAFDEFKVKMKDATDNEKRKMNASMIDEITKIADPNTPDEIKLNYAISAFHPNNRNFISRLNVDSKDSQGRPIEGQNAVFQKLTSPEITKEMKRLGEKNPEIWKNYVNWTQETLGNELMSREFRYLGEIRNPAIKLGWDSENKRFTEPQYTVSAENAKSMGLNQTIPDPEFYTVKNAVNRINSNLANYKNVAEASGKNVEAFMLGTIVQAVGPQSLAKVDNIPADIIRQIGLTQLKKKTDANSNK